VQAIVDNSITPLAHWEREGGQPQRGWEVGEVATPGKSNAKILPLPHSLARSAIHIISPSPAGRERCHEVTERVRLEGGRGDGARKQLRAE